MDPTLHRLKEQRMKNIFHFTESTNNTEKGIATDNAAD